MKNRIFPELIISLGLIILLVLLANPFEFWMPDAMLMLILALLLTAFSVFAALLWKERARDEREQLHKLTADRVGFLAGSGLLLLAIIVQSLNHAIDVWLIVTLGVMVIAKMSGLVYSHIKY